MPDTENQVQEGTTEQKPKFDKEAYLKGALKDAVDLRVKKDAALQAITCNVAAACEKLEISPTYFRKLVDMEYFKEYDSEKFESQIDFVMDIVDHFSDDMPDPVIPPNAQ